MAPAQGGRASGYAAVIGDVVGSRDADAGLFGRLQEALDRTNGRVEGLQPLRVTIGDEFQGLFPALGPALNATLLLRLLLHGVTEVRFGVGWGGLTRWSAARAPYEQDGPAWWAAREALEAVKQQERGIGTPAGWRTAVRFGEPDGGDRRPLAPPAVAAEGAPEPRPVDVSLDASMEALVMFRDHAVSRLDERDVSLVLALLDDATVAEAGEQAGISQQAASRRLRTNGGYALLRSWHLLEGTD